MKQLFDAKLWIKRDLSHFIQKKKKKKKLTLKQLKSCSKHDVYPICLMETACTQQ